MTVTNLDISQIAIRGSDEPDRVQREREFTVRYQRAVETSGLATAEVLAKSEALYVALQLDFEAGAFIRSHLR